MRLGTSYVLSRLLTSSTKPSCTIWVSVNRNTTCAAGAAAARMGHGELLWRAGRLGEKAVEAGAGCTLKGGGGHVCRAMGTDAATREGVQPPTFWLASPAILSTFLMSSCHSNLPYALEISIWNTSNSCVAVRCGVAQAHVNMRTELVHRVTGARRLGQRGYRPSPNHEHAQPAQPPGPHTTAACYATP